jgi:hypothetical protein
MSSIKSSIQNVYPTKTVDSIEIVGVRSSIESKESVESPSFRRLIAIEDPEQPTMER